MEVRLIENKELLESAELFKIENLLWGTEKIAKTYGYIGFVPGDGLYIKLVCEEKNPLRIYKKDQDPVYKDSAMEAFFQFKGNDTEDEMWRRNTGRAMEGESYASDRNTGRSIREIEFTGRIRFSLQFL